MIRTSLLPPAKTEDWYGKTRPCTSCRASILFRKEDPARIVVKHERKCLALRGVRTGRKVRKGQPTSDAPGSGVHPTRNES